MESNTNIITKIIENNENRMKEQYKNVEWGISQRSRLVKVLEAEGANITEYMWDLLLFNINGLRIVNDKVCYISFYKPSKRILELFGRYNKVIISNFDYIVKG